MFCMYHFDDLTFDLIQIVLEFELLSILFTSLKTFQWEPIALISILRTQQNYQFSRREMLQIKW